MQTNKAVYDWSEFESRIKQKGFKNLRDWCDRNGVKYKTLYGLMKNFWPCSYGPRAQHIIDLALEQELIAETEAAA